jgi:branched-chain amino acid aminotransferase
MSSDVINELKNISNKARVFASMPYIEGLTPAVFGQEDKVRKYDSDEIVERREGIFRMDEIGLSPLDHGGLYGDAVFEGILINYGHIFLFKEHILRWWESARKLSIQFPYTKEDMAWRIFETIQAVDFAEGEKGYLRPIITRGFGNLGIHPKKCIAPTIYCICSTIQLYPPEAYETGIELAVARRIRRPGQVIIDPNVKSCNYLNNILGLLETIDRGKLETMMITARGQVAEATADNLFLVFREEGWENDPSKVVIHTPSSDYCLIGITRNVIMQEARNLGYKVIEADDMLAIDFIGSGRECFMTGTGCGLMPIVGIEDRDVGDGKPGPVTKILLEAITNNMKNPEYGLSIKAGRDEVLDYMKRPTIYER